MEVSAVRQHDLNEAAAVFPDNEPQIMCYEHATTAAAEAPDNELSQLMCYEHATKKRKVDGVVSVGNSGQPAQAATVVEHHHHYYYYPVTWGGEWQEAAPAWGSSWNDGQTWSQDTNAAWLESSPPGDSAAAASDAVPPWRQDNPPVVEVVDAPPLDVVEIVEDERPAIKKPNAGLVLSRLAIDKHPKNVYRFDPPCKVELYSVGIRQLNLLDVNRSPKRDWHQAIRDGMNQYYPDVPEMSYVFDALKLHDPNDFGCTGENLNVLNKMYINTKILSILSRIKHVVTPAFKRGRVVRILTFCKSGKHRSVCLSRAQHFIYSNMGLQVEEPVHLSSGHWPNHLCHLDCWDCDHTNPEKVNVLERFWDFWNQL